MEVNVSRFVETNYFQHSFLLFHRNQYNFMSVPLTARFVQLMAAHEFTMIVENDVFYRRQITCL